MSEPTHVFLFCDPDYDGTAYQVTPDENGPFIVQHQYGCVSCLQFEMRGHITPVSQEQADRLDKLLGCEYASVEKIQKETGLCVDSVWGESLMRLQDGSFIATNNCD